MKYYTLTYITLNLTDLLTCALALAGFKFQLGHLLAECLFPHWQNGDVISTYRIGLPEDYICHSM